MSPQCISLHQTKSCMQQPTALLSVYRKSINRSMSFRSCTEARLLRQHKAELALRRTSFLTISAAPRASRQEPRCEWLHDACTPLINRRTWPQLRCRTDRPGGNTGTQDP